MTEEKGFTLTELLLTIVILIGLAMLSSAIILNVIHHEQEKSFKSTANSLLASAQLYYAENDRASLYINYNGKNNTTLLDYNGNIPDGGELKIDASGKIQMAIWHEKTGICMVKNLNDNEIIVNSNIKTNDDCLIVNIDK